MFKRFEELGISTQTVIAVSGMDMEIEEFFRKIPIDDVEGEVEIVSMTAPTTEEAGCPKKHSLSKKKHPTVPIELSAEDDQVTEWFTDPSYQKNQHEDHRAWTRILPFVKCRAMYFKNSFKVHPSFFFQKRERYFRNALNVVLSFGNKFVNFKLSKNGKFQITGCKYLWHAQLCVVAFLQRIRQWCPHPLYEETLRVYFQTVMTNVDFNIGHTIDRTKLDELINGHTPYYSLLETSFGYTGVNIKFPIPQEWWRTIEVPLVEIGKDPASVVCRPIILDHVLDDTERARLRAKMKYNTFLVFHSGNVIMSGMSPTIMKPDYEVFTNLLTDWSKTIRETIHEDHRPVVRNT